MTDSEPPASSRRRLAGRLADAVVSPIMGAVDVESVVEQIDVQAIIEQVDIDALIQRVDINELIERVDINALIQGVDMNAVLETVDMNSLMERTEIGAIVARSTTGMFGQLLDVARSVVIIIDLLIHKVLGRIIRPRGDNRPGVPGDIDDVVQTSLVSKSETAVALQGHFAGPLSRLLGFVTDQFLIGSIFTAAQFLFGVAVALVAGVSWNPADHRLLTATVYVLWAFTYTVTPLAALGRTPGMAIVGLLVVRADGSEIRPRDAVVRTIALPFSFVLFGLGLILGLLRRDRRQLQDLLAGTAVIYTWDAQLARLRESRAQT
ncbi:MAG: RDD family protein [Microthrixaceae bacterium]